MGSVAFSSTNNSSTVKATGGAIVVHHSDNMVLVFNLKTVEETRSAYETLCDN